MKKTKSFVSILTIVALLLGALGAISANATGPVYQAKDVTAYVFSVENTKTITCLFRDDLPEVPYINPMDYLNIIFADQFTEVKNDDGTYTVTNAYGSEMIVNAAADTIYFKDFDAFMDCITNDDGSSIDITFIEFKEGFYSVEPEAVTLDLSKYNIDIAEANDKAYVPLAVIAAMFSVTYNNAVYFEGDICFVHTMDPECYYYNVDESSRYQELTRTQAMADFNYNTLCFYMDCFFGKPSNTVIAEDLNEKGFDKTLDEFDEYTQFAKQLLLSTDMIEYYDGLVILSYYCFDGGHTVLMNPPISAVNYYSDQPLGAAWFDHFINGESDLSYLTYDFYDMQVSTFDFDTMIYNVRTEEYEKYADEIAMYWEETGAYLIIHGDIAVFVFDSFELDTPYNIKEALDIAKEAGVKNFLLDDSCNGGGYVVAYEYICAIISNERYRSNEYATASMNPLTGSVAEYVYKFDLNLDGTIDDADNDVYYDFNFGILTSRSAFSCGNELPVNARNRGIMILGEPSGGGSCYVTERYLADGLCYPTSDIGKSVLPDGSDVDLGAPVDFDLTAVDDEENVIYNGFYDLDHISELMSGFYKTVKFVDYDGTVIREGKYRAGETVVVPSDPEREADEEFTYTFSGWDKEITAVTEDVTYTAVYDKAEKFVPGDINGDGTTDNKDVVVLFRYSSGADIDVNVVALDVNGDGAVDNKDVVVLFRYLSGDTSIQLSEKPYIPADEVVYIAAARRVPVLFTVK